MRKKFEQMFLLLILLLVLLGGAIFGDIKSADSKMIDSKKQDYRVERTTKYMKYISIGYVSTGIRSLHYDRSYETIKNIFPKEAGYELIYTNGLCNPQKQQELVEEFVQQAVDYIILDPIEDVGWQEVLDDCQIAGIPVIVVDGKIKDSAKYCTWIGHEIADDGLAAGSWYTSYSALKGIEDTRILLISDSEQREYARINAFRSCANTQLWSIVDELECENDKVVVSEKLAPRLSEYFLSDTPVNLIVCQHDNQLLGVVETLRNQGIDFGPESDITIIAFDASLSGMELLRKGDINAEFVCYPVHGSSIFSVINQLQAHKEIPQKIYLDTSIYCAKPDIKYITYRSDYGRRITKRTNWIKDIQY